MASKAALAFVGLAAVAGIGLAVSHAKAAPTPPPQPEPDEPTDPHETPHPLPTDDSDQPAEPPADNGNAGSSGDQGGAGSAGPTIEDVGLGTEPIQFLPSPIRNLNLTGKERIHYAGIGTYGPEKEEFLQYVVNDTLNGMDMYVFVHRSNHDEWISMFKHFDPDGSTPPFHFIVYQISDTPNKLWMIQNIAGLDH